MLTSRFSLLLSVTSTLACALAIVACGGNVVFAPDGDDGAGGSGAGPSTTNVSVGPGTTSVSSSVSVVSSNNSSNQSGPSVSSSTGTGTFCDTGEPASIDSFQCGECVQCAQNGPCIPTIEACFSDADCSALIDCFNNCGDDACYEQCQFENQDGLDGYIAIIECMVCDACPSNCDAMNNCPFQ